MKFYKNQSTGMCVVTGKVKDISEDRMVMTVISNEYSTATKTNNETEIKVSSGVPYEANIKPGFSVTAAGYQRGKGNILADMVAIGNDVLETQDLAVVCGLVKFARMNEEKNQDGSPKVKADGVTPKKPHFDICISVKEGDKYVDHIIKVYDNPNSDRNPMEQAAKAFAKFDKENNRIRATFVTAPGAAYDYVVNRNGQEYVNYGCSHMGFKLMDLEFIDQREKTQAPPVKEQPKASQEVPAKQVSAQPQSGFDTQPELDDTEVVFN